MVSPHAQEVEYALLLSRMISTVKEDPLQMRLTIYEFARARLKIDMSWAVRLNVSDSRTRSRRRSRGLNSSRPAATRRNAFSLRPQPHKLHQPT